MNLNNLKARTSFPFGDRNFPLPKKLCLIKLTDKYLSRSNCPFKTKYIVGSSAMVGQQLKICLNSATDEYKQVFGTWNENAVESWTYMEDVEKLMAKKKR